MPEYSVRVAALDGTWETVGADRQAGVWPEGLELSADGWGGKSCTFDLRRDPAAVWPDISAFTPVEVDVEGQLVWSGRVSETPSRDGTDRVLSVVCEGWQHHLDDDLVDAAWVYQRLSGFVDSRTMSGASLGAGGGQLPASGQVSVGDGGITLMWPKDITLPQYAKVGVTLDFGPVPARWPERFVVEWDGSMTSSRVDLHVRSADSADAGSGSGWADVTTAWNGGATSGVSVGTSGTRRRYLHLFMETSSAGTVGNAGSDVWFRVKRVLCAYSASFESGNQSALKASKVVTDVLDSGTPLLSTDRSGITATSFSIPEYAPDGPRTPREHIAAVNAYHGWMAKVDPGRRIVFAALPSRPKFTVGDWSAVELQDAAGNSGQDIYNRVLVTGQDPAGQPVQISRFTSSFDVVRSGGWPNPSFDTNTTGWTTVVGSLTRTTTAGQFDTSPGAGALSSATIASTSTLTTGNIQAGRTYRVTVRLKGSGNQDCQIQIGSNQGFSQQIASVTSAAFQTFTLFYTARAGDTALAFSAGFGVGASYTLYIDSLTLEVSSQTLADRRGFIRAKQLQVSPTLPSDGVAAAALGDAWLAGHATTPFRGTINITGPDAVRDRTSGQPIPPHQLLRDTGELIHFADRINPDTGAMGRDARITAVTYKPDTDQATITLDNTRSDLDALLSRLAVVQGAA